MENDGFDQLREQNRAEYRRQSLHNLTLYAGAVAVGLVGVGVKLHEYYDTAAVETAQSNAIAGISLGVGVVTATVAGVKSLCDSRRYAKNNALLNVARED